MPAIDVTRTARYAEPTRYGAFAAGARTFGYDAYRETVFSLGYARRFDLGTARRIHAGIATRYHRLSLGASSGSGASYGSAGALVVSAGALVRLLPRFTLGVAATNLNAAAYTDGGPGLAQTLAVGVAYRASGRFLVTADAFKDIDFPLSARAGVEVTPVEALALRVGVGNAPARVTAGAGLRAGPLRARMAFERHETLGWTPAAGLAYQW